MLLPRSLWSTRQARTTTQYSALMDVLLQVDKQHYQQNLYVVCSIAWWGTHVVKGSVDGDEFLAFIVNEVVSVLKPQLFPSVMLSCIGLLVTKDELISTGQKYSDSG